MPGSEANGDTAAGNASAKPKRVRTGCLTCRERHLKCDEGLPICLNCKKSSRVCRRGLRLNFIDTQVQAPPVIPYSEEWNVHFTDESRDIASEYQGGLARYGVKHDLGNEQMLADTSLQADQQMQFSYNFSAPTAPTMNYQGLPTMPSGMPDTTTTDHGLNDALSHDQFSHTAHSTSVSPFSNQLAHGSAFTHPGADLNHNHNAEKREYLNSQDEVLFMQVFVEEVGIWMDSMDSAKHVSCQHCSKHTY